MRFAIALVATLALAAQASATVTSVSATVLGTSGTTVPNTVTNDILIDFEGGALRGQQIFFELTAGTIYNTPGTGTNTAPAAAFLGLVPELEFDTFVTMGGTTAETSEDVLVVGGAVNIPGAPAALSMTDPTVFSVAYAPAPGVDIAPASGFQTARITLSDDAAGQLIYFGSVDGADGAVVDTLPIVGGVIGIIPEPTAAVLLGLATCGVATLRKRG